MPKMYTEAEVKALLEAASASADIEDIAKRPYHTVKDAGGVVCLPPSQGGPLTIDGQHPNDYYNVEKDDKGGVKLDADGHATAQATGGTN